MESVVVIFLACLVTLASLGAGRTLLSSMRFRFNSVCDEVVFSVGAGFGLLIYGMVIIGVVGWYRPEVAWGVIGVFILIGTVGLLQRPRRINLRFSIRAALRSRGKWPFVALLAMLLIHGIAYLMVALSPTIEADSMGGYLLTAREFARQGSIVSIDYAYGDSYPMGGQMLSVLGFLLRGQILAQLMVVWIMGLLGIAVIYAFSRAFSSHTSALVAITVWYGMYSVAYLATSAKIDLVWAAFDLLAILAFSRWYFAERQERDWRWLLLAGLFLGVAGGIKQTSAFTIAVLSAGIAFRLLSDESRKYTEYIRAYALLWVPAFFAGIWVIRSYLITGSPFFTGGNFQSENGLLGFIRTLWDMSMLGNASALEGALGKSVGPTILAVTPLVLLIHHVNRVIWHILVFCGLMLLMWFIGVQRARHLLPTLALLSVVAGYVIIQLLANRPRLARLLIWLVLASLTLNFGAWTYINFISIQRLPYVLGLHDLDRYLQTNLPKLRFYPNYSILLYARTHLSEHTRIAALSSGASFYLDHPFYDIHSTYVHISTTWKDTPTETPLPEEFIHRLRSADITHVFVNDYVVDKRKLDAAWLANPAFQQRYLEKLLCSEGQCLFAIR